MERFICVLLVQTVTAIEIITPLLTYVPPPHTSALGSPPTASIFQLSFNPTLPASQKLNKFVGALLERYYCPIVVTHFHVELCYAQLCYDAQ
jgi:hypothetical protein